MNYDYQQLRALKGEDATANDNYYRDATHINSVQKDIENGKKDSISIQLAVWIRQKKFGIDVREALARFVEWISVLTNRNIEKSEKAVKRADQISDNFKNLTSDVEDFKNDFNDRYNAQIAGNTDLNEVIDARTSRASKSNYATLGQRLDMLDEVELKDLTDKTFLVNESYDIGDGRIIKSAKTFAEQLDDKKMNVTVITDGHEQDWYLAEGQNTDYNYGYLATTHLNGFLEIADKSDFSIALGDNANGLFPEKYRTIADLQLYADKLFYADTEADIAIIPGNHDDGSPKTYYNKLPVDNIITNDEMKKILKTADLRFGENRQDDDSLYFYKDYPDKKVRVVVLYSEDVPEDIPNEEGTLKYPRWYWHGYMQDQVTWLAEKALRNVPEDYHVMFMAHTPLNGNGYLDNDKNAVHVNSDIVLGIIDAFQNGKGFATSFDGGSHGPEWKVSVAVDFSAQGPRPVIGWFNGHKHTEAIYTPEKNGSKFPMIFLLNDVNPNTKPENVGTEKEYAMTTIEIDTATRSVNLKGFGRATNRAYKY